MENRLSRSELRALHLGIFTVVVAVIFLCVTSQTLIKPALKSLRFEETICRVITVKVAKQSIDSAKSRSHHHSNECFDYESVNNPCTQVIVYYNSPFVSAVNGSDSLEKSYINKSYNGISTVPPFWMQHKANLHINNQQQAQLYMSDIDLLYNDECSFRTRCGADETIATEMRNTFHSKVRFLGNRFVCFYDPRNPSITLMYRTFNEWSIFHGIFWPLLLLLLGIFIVVILYCWIGKLKKNIKQRWKNEEKKAFYRS